MEFSKEKDKVNLFLNFTGKADAAVVKALANGLRSILPETNQIERSYLTGYVESITDAGVFDYSSCTVEARRSEHGWNVPAVVAIYIAEDLTGTQLEVDVATLLVNVLNAHAKTPIRRPGDVGSVLDLVEKNIEQHSMAYAVGLPLRFRRLLIGEVCYFLGDMLGAQESIAGKLWHGVTIKIDPTRTLLLMHNVTEPDAPF